MTKNKLEEEFMKELDLPDNTNKSGAIIEIKRVCKEISSNWIEKKEIINFIEHTSNKWFRVVLKSELKNLIEGER